MNEMQQAAYIIAQAACAQIEAISMQSVNATALAQGGGPKYNEGDFQELLVKYGIHHNAVIAFFNRL